MTTTQKQAVLITVAVVLVQIIGFATQYWVVKRDLGARLERLVEADLAGFAALYDQRRIIAVRQAIAFRMISGAERGMLLSLTDRDGGQMAGNIAPWPRRVLRPPEGQRGKVVRFEHDGARYVGVAQNLRGRFALLVARSTAENDASLARYRQIFAAVIAVSLMVSTGVGYLASQVTMRRIRRINALSDRVARGELSARLPAPASDDEYALLERHIHAMLDRIEALNGATQQLSDTIAHELRTPLTRIQNQLGKLTPPTPESAAAAEGIRDTIRIFDSLLQIARAEAAGGRELDLKPLDLSGLVHDMAELYQPLAEDRGMVFAARIAPDVEILGDRNLVAQLISNLLDNALKFSPRGAEVVMDLRTNGDKVLEITDTGPGLPEGFEGSLFERFSRADTGKGGHGLGMALVRAIAVRHGAKMVVVPVKRGFAIQIVWPSVH